LLVSELKETGCPFEYESVKINYLKTHTYKPDFVFPKQRLLVEAKGYFSSSDRSKILGSLEEITKHGWRS